MSFERVCSWLERIWRYKNITKVIGDYNLRRFEEMLAISSNDKKKLYTFVVSKDFLRLEFIVSFDKLKEFYEEVKALNYYFEGALTPFIWKLNECYKCAGSSGLIRGLYHIINTNTGMVVGVNFIAKTQSGQKTYSDVFPLNFEFKGIDSLNRFAKNREKSKIGNIISRIKQYLKQY